MAPTSRLGLAIALAALGSGCSLLAPDDDHFAGGPKPTDGGTGGGIACAPLPAPAGKTVSVTAAQAAELPSLVASAAADTTLVLESGTYAIGQTLRFEAPRVTLRSASDDAASVVLDGGGALDILIQIAASDVTVAHLTVTGTTLHGVLVSAPGSGLGGARLYDMRLIDAGEQYVRIAPGVASGYADEGTVECSLFRMTDATRGAACCTTCAPIALSVVAGAGWALRGSRFEDIYCDNGQLPFGALFSGGSRDTLVENNLFLGCARGLGLGLIDGADSPIYPDMPYGGVVLDHIDGVVRNNVIYSDRASFDTGMELNDAREPRVLHNTVVHGPGALGAYRSIDFRYADTKVVVKNNLAISLGPRDGASGDVTNNLEQTPLGYFVDPAAADFHLGADATDAIDRGVPVAGSGVDLDGEAHDVGAAPDLGADERSP